MAPGRVGVAWTRVVVAAVLFLIPSCGCEEGSTNCPEVQVPLCSTPRDFHGGFFGTVNAAGNPYPARFAANNYSQSGMSFRFMVQTRSDSMGRYQVLLPPGKCNLQVVLNEDVAKSINSDGELLDHATTATIPDSLPRRLDIAFPSEVRITVHAPAGWESTVLRLTSHPAVAEWIGSRAAVRDGIAVFRVVGLPAGVYTFGVNGPDAKLSLPPRFPAVGDSVLVPADGLLERSFTVPEPGHLRMMLTGSMGEMGVYPSVAGLIADSVQVLGSPGMVEREMLWPVYYPSRNVRLRVTLGAKVGWYGGTNFDSAARIDLTPGDDVTVEYLDCGIEGTFRPFGGAGREWVLIEAFSLEGRRGGGDRTQGPAGNFYIGNLEPDAYLLKIMGTQDWPEQWYDSVLDFHRATVILTDTSRPLVHLAIDSVAASPLGIAQ